MLYAMGRGGCIPIKQKLHLSPTLKLQLRCVFRSVGMKTRTHTGPLWIRSDISVLDNHLKGASNSGADCTAS